MLQELLMKHQRVGKVGPVEVPAWEVRGVHEKGAYYARNFVPSNGSSWPSANSLSGTQGNSLKIARCVSRSCVG